jgi:hypothetical protein
VNAHVLVFAPELYPDLAERWYEAHTRHFWQKTWWAAGFREFARDWPDGEWTYDVDAGPIIGGFSPSANAFGLAAAKANGRLDHAYTLGAQVLAACWPLPDGRLLGPRILSDREHAPYLGETAILWQLTEKPAPGVDLVHGGFLAGAVYIGFAFYFGGSLLLFSAVWRKLRRWRRRKTQGGFLCVRVQFTLWTALVLAGVGLLACSHLAFGVLALLTAQVLPMLFVPTKGAEATGASTEAKTQGKPA